MFADEVRVIPLVWNTCCYSDNHLSNISLGSITNGLAYFCWRVNKNKKSFITEVPGREKWTTKCSFHHPKLDTTRFFKKWFILLEGDRASYGEPGNAN
jgi:hypothetical protein